MQSDDVFVEIYASSFYSSLTPKVNERRDMRDTQKAMSVGTKISQVDCFWEKRTLALSDCGLTGSLPVELSNTVLERLLLDRNRFIGTVPGDYARLPLCELILDMHNEVVFPSTPVQI